MNEYIKYFEESILKPFLDKKNIKFQKQGAEYFYFAFTLHDNFGDFHSTFFETYNIISNHNNRSYSDFVYVYDIYSKDSLSLKDREQLLSIIDFISKNIHLITVKSYNPFIS